MNEIGLVKLLALESKGDDVSTFGELDSKLVLIVRGLEGFVELLLFAVAATFVFELLLFTVGLFIVL